MFGIKFIRFDTTKHVVLYKNGKIKMEGRGLSFFYYAPNSSIAAIPVGSNDVQFIFNELTVDFQTISIQGQITYKIENPKQLAEYLDFTVDHNGEYKTNELEKLHQRLINEAQTATSAFVQSLELKQAVRSAKKIEENITAGLKTSKAVQLLGIEPLSINVIAVKPDPKTEKALEAATRESLQKEADLAVYNRRQFSVEQERIIKETELSTEIAIEEKKRQISEKKMETDVLNAENERKLREMRINADISVDTIKMEGDIKKEENNKLIRKLKVETEIAVEEQRTLLVNMSVANKKKEADAKGYEIEVTLQPYKNIDWKVLSAISGDSNNPANQMGLAFREMAENAQKIGTLNITPDLLQTIVQQQR